MSSVLSLFFFFAIKSSSNNKFSSLSQFLNSFMHGSKVVTKLEGFDNRGTLVNVYYMG